MIKIDKKELDKLIVEGGKDSADLLASRKTSWDLQGDYVEIEEGLLSVLEDYAKHNQQLIKDKGKQVNTGEQPQVLWAGDKY